MLKTLNIVDGFENQNFPEVKLKWRINVSNPATVQKTFGLESTGLSNKKFKEQTNIKQKFTKGANKHE